MALFERPDAALPAVFGFESLGEVVAMGGDAKLALGTSVTSLQFGRGYRQHFPDGVDLALDTVGGETFDAVVAQLANHGRVVSAGFTSDTPEPAPVLAPRIYERLCWKSASVRSFMNPLHKASHPEAHSALVKLMECDALDIWLNEPLFRGLDQVVDAIAHLRARKNTGKVIVEIE